MEAPEISWRPLGRLLVDKGLLTEERLEEALAAQAKTEGRLGDTLVELGYVSRSSLARALAEQYGMELTVETGFGSGLQARIERRHDESNAWQLASGPQSNQELPPLVLVQPVEEPPAPVEDTSTQMAALEEQWAKLAAAEDRVAEVERELENVRASAGRREAQVVRFVDRVRRRDAQIADLSTAGPEVDAQATTDEGLAELQSELDAVRATSERRQAQVVRFVGHVRRRDAQIAELSAAATGANAEAASDDRLAELQSELDAIRADAERRQAQVVRFVGRVRRRDAQIAELSTADPDVDALAAAEAQVAELQGQLDELSADAGQRQAQVSRFGRGRKRDAQTAELAAAEEEVHASARKYRSGTSRLAPPSASWPNCARRGNRSTRRSRISSSRFAGATSRSVRSSASWLRPARRSGRCRPARPSATRKSRISPGNSVSATSSLVRPTGS